MSWINRETVVYKIDSLPLDADGKIVLMEPWNVCVSIGLYVNPVDVGAWCYRRRKRVCLYGERKRRHIVLVDPESFSKSRAPIVLAFLEYMLHQHGMGIRETTISQRINEVNKFVVWLGEHETDDFYDRDNFKEILLGYTRFLFDEVRASRINVNTASSRQRTIIEVGRYIFSDLDSDLYDELKRIRKSVHAVNVTEKPDDELAGRMLKIYLNVFNSLSLMVLRFEKFPYKIVIGNEYFWFFPTSVPIAGPSNIGLKQALSNRFRVYDYINGCIRDGAVVSKNSRDVALKNIENANNNRFHSRRIFAATLAAQSFVMLFSANTGMGLGQICELRWTGQYSIENETQGFKTIKYRANGKITSFLISKNFFRIFKQYLQLRDYLIEHSEIENYERLFFSLKHGDLVPLGMNLSNDFHRRLNNCFNFDVKITTRSWRVNKSDWLLRNSDLATTSMVLQNSIDTVLKHYSKGSEKQAQDELREFLNNYSDKVIVSEKSKLKGVSIGQCSEYGEPDVIKEQNSVFSLDCRTPEGCLFCKKFRVSPNLDDYRKLLSYQYVLNETKFLYDNDYVYENEYLRLVSRIEDIAAAIERSGNIPDEELDKTRKLVLQGYELDDYWSRKLSIIDEMGVLY